MKRQDLERQIAVLAIELAMLDLPGYQPEAGDRVRVSITPKVGGERRSMNFFIPVRQGDVLYVREKISSGG